MCIKGGEEQYLRKYFCRFVKYIAELLDGDIEICYSESEEGAIKLQYGNSEFLVIVTAGEIRIRAEPLSISNKGRDLYHRIQVEDSEFVELLNDITMRTGGYIYLAYIEENPSLDLLNGYISINYSQPCLIVATEIHGKTYYIIPYREPCYDYEDTLCL